MSNDTQPRSRKESLEGTVLAIGAGPEQLPTIETAAAMGCRVVAVDANTDAPGLKTADRGEPIDITDERRLIELGEIEEVDCVLPAPVGRYLTTVGAVNDALDLRGPGKSTIQACVNKLSFRRKLMPTRLAQPTFETASNPTQIRAAIDKIGAPCIIKPCFGSGSRGVKVFLEDNQADALTEWFTARCSDSFNALIEELIVGREIGCDAVVDNGQITLVLCRNKSMTDLPYRQELGFDAPAHLSAQTRRKVRDALSCASHAVGLESGVLHADVLLRGPNTEPVILEMAPRLSGLRVSDIIVPTVTGQDFPRRVISWLASDSPFSWKSKTESAVAFRFLDIPSGTLKSWNARKILRNQTSVQQWHTRLKPDTRLETIESGREALQRGWFITVGPDVDTAVRDADDILQQIIDSSTIRDTT